MIQPSANGTVNGRFTGRGYVPALRSPHPLGAFLPAIYQLKHPFEGMEDRAALLFDEPPFVMRWTEGLDLILAPIFSSLDNFEAYLDPGVAPLDFLDWLGTWMGLIIDETWPIERRRTFVSQANALYRMRGTPKGLAAHVQIFTGGGVTILERGGTAWSSVSGGKLPGSTGFDMIVRVRVDDPSQVDAARLDALVAAAKPAHLSHKVEVVALAAPAPAPPPAVETPPPPPPDAPPSETGEAPPGQPE